VRVVGTKRLLPDRQRSLEKRLGVSVATLLFVELSQVVERCRNVRAIRTERLVESRCGAVSLGRTYLFPPLSYGGALVVRPWLRFHIPLIEPDMGAPIRLSDKTSDFRSRKAMSLRLQFNEPQGLVEVLVRKACRPRAANLMLRA